MIRFQAGFLANHFGASNFYHPKFYDQYEETNAIFSSLSWEHHLNKNLQSLVNLSIRKHSDLYDFNTYRLAETSWGSVNFHQTDVYDGEWKLKYRWAGGVTSGGLEFRNEGILSNRLGEELTHPIPVKDFEGQYLTKGINRNNFSGYLEHQKRWQTFLISAGSLVNFNSQFGTEFYPGIDMSWFPANGMTVYTSVNRSLRFPTFTELYLNTSTVRADPLLLPEKAVNYELGYKWFKPHWNMTFAAFYKQTRDAIDKIKRPELSVPTMENIDNINMTGIEWNASWSFDSRPNSILSIDRLILNYAALKADRKEDGFQSFYTLNYLRQNLTGGVTLKTLEDLSLSVFGTYRARAGAYQWDSESPLLPYKDVYLLDMRIDYKLNRFNFYADCRNLLNFTYQDFGFVEQPGIWVSGGLRVSFL
jgi:iron complex outermembrane receptor protein